MIEQNRKEFEFLNIPLWWAKGYTGKGIKIAEIESCNPDAWMFQGRLKDPFDYKCETLNIHGQKVLDVALQIAPDATPYILPSGLKTSGQNKASGTLIEKTIPYAIEEGIHLINASVGGTDNIALKEVVLEAQKHGVCFGTSAGNSGHRTDSNTLGGYAKSDAWDSTGAVGLKNDKNTTIDDVYLKDYSSRGEQIDFVSFSGLYVRDAKNKTRVFNQEGTSFSSPALHLGLSALVQQFFLEKAGRTLYQEELYKFKKDNSIDLGEKGHDELYGHGLFVLPNPDEIVIEDYLFVDVTNLGKINKITMDTPSIIINGRFHVPARFLAEALGGEVSWDETTKTGTFKVGNKVVEAIDGSNVLTTREVE